MAQSVAWRDFASCAFHPPLPSRQGTTLVGHSVEQMRPSRYFRWHAMEYGFMKNEGNAG
jgi:hypothetical protein